MITLCAECVLTGQRTPAVTLVGGTALCVAHVHRRPRHSPTRTAAAPPASLPPSDATLADLVRNSRRAQRLTQEKLSHLTGLSTATLRRIEHGYSVGVRVTTRLALERALGLPAGTLSAAQRRSTAVSA